MPKRSIPFAAPAALSLALGAQGAMQVAPEWPQLPEGWKLGQGSGVSVGRDGRVYVLHRGERPFLLVDQSGKVTRHWGDIGGVRLDSRFPMPFSLDTPILAGRLVEQNLSLVGSAFPAVASR